MKKLYVLMIAAGMMFITSQEAMACWGFSRTHQHRAVESPSTQDPGAVGAPLDGGLLAILAAAGGAYFVARRKKKNQQ